MDRALILNKARDLFAGPPVHGGPGRGRRRRRHGRSGRAHHGGSRGLGEPRKAHGRAVREQANSGRSVAAAGHGRDAQATRWHGSVPAAKLRRARSRSREGERGRERHRRDPHLAAKLGQVFSLSRTRRLVRSTVARSSTRRRRQRRCAARAREAAAAALGFNGGCGALGEGPL